MILNVLYFIFGISRACGFHISQYWFLPHQTHTHSNSGWAHDCGVTAVAAVTFAANGYCYMDFAMAITLTVAGNLPGYSCCK